MGLHEPPPPYLCSKDKSISLTRIKSVHMLSHKQTFYLSPILPLQAQTVPYGMAARYAKASTEEELRYVQQETSG